MSRAAIFPKGYKQTEVGVIPEDWKISAVAEVAEVKTGPFGSALHEKDYVKNGTPIITVEHLGERGVRHTTIPMVSDSDKIRLKAYSLSQGDIVFSRVGSVDRNALIKTTEDGWLFSGRLLRVRPKWDKVDSPYLSYHFHSEVFRQRVKDVAVGQTMASINTQILLSMKIILPPTKAEQETIAAALSDADALIESLEQLIVKKRHLKQGAMQELLTGKRRLPGFEKKPGFKQTEVGVIPVDWDVDYVECLSNITTGSKNTQDRVDDGEYPFFVRSQIIERINSYSYDGEAVLTAGDGVGTGKVFHYINGKFDVHQRVYRISHFNERINGYYFYLYFSSNFFSRIMQMTAKSSVDSVRREMIARMPIPLPSDKAEQETIAAILSGMEDEITLLFEKLSKVRQVKQGMMQELLTGRIRLV